MKIAILALGSLATDSAPRLDGPLLPIEFTWTTAAPQGRLILAFCDELWVLNVRTPWVMSTLDDFDQARRDLAQREAVNWETEIGYLTLDENDAISHRFNTLHVTQNQVLGRLKQWGLENQCDAIIWRDRPADVNFPHGENFAVADNALVGHLQGAAAVAAEKYVRRVPMQVWTVMRARLAVQPGWMPQPADAAITTADDPRLKDWQECRTTIGRIDQYLEDLRKFGFSLITGLLTAGAFLGFVPAATSAVSSDERAGVFMAIMVLVTALFSVDTYYQVLLSGAVERALDLENQTDPPIRVTKYLSVNATNSGVSYITLFLYLVLLAMASGLGLLDARGLNLGLWPTEVLFWGWVGGLGVFLIVMIVVRWLWPSRPDWLLLVMGGVLGVWFTGGLGLLLLESAVAIPPATTPPAVLPWIVGVAVFLAVYMELYWVYVALRSGLHREKPQSEREWREGRGKVPAP